MYFFYWAPEMMLMTLQVFLRGMDLSSLFRQQVVVVRVVQNGMQILFKMIGWMLNFVLLHTFTQYIM